MGKPGDRSMYVSGLSHIAQQTSDYRSHCRLQIRGEQVESKSHEIIKQLNRLINDRSLPMQARNKINAALQHIKELQLELETAQDMTEA